MYIYIYIYICVCSTRTYDNSWYFIVRHMINYSKQDALDNASTRLTILRVHHQHKRLKVCRVWGICPTRPHPETVSLAAWESLYLPIWVCLQCKQHFSFCAHARWKYHGTDKSQRHNFQDSSILATVTGHLLTYKHFLAVIPGLVANNSKFKVHHHYL